MPDPARAGGASTGCSTANALVEVPPVGAGSHPSGRTRRVPGTVRATLALPLRFPPSVPGGSLYRVRSRTRVLLACAATAGLLVGCGNAPDTKAPDIQTLPSPIAVPLPSPSTTTTTTTPAPTGKPKPASAQPGRRSVQPGNAGAVPVVGAGPGFRATGGDEFNGGALDTKKWGLYDSVGGFGNGLRRPS